MKKIVSILLMLVMVCAVVSCTKETETPIEENITVQEEEDAIQQAVEETDTPDFRIGIVTGSF